MTENNGDIPISKQIEEVFNTEKYSNLIAEAQDNLNFGDLANPSLEEKIQILKRVKLHLPYMPPGDEIAQELKQKLENLLPKEKLQKEREKEAEIPTKTEDTPQETGEKLIIADSTSKFETLQNTEQSGKEVAGGGDEWSPKNDKLETTTVKRSVLGLMGKHPVINSTLFYILGILTAAATLPLTGLYRVSLDDKKKDEGSDVVKVINTIKTKKEEGSIVHGVRTAEWKRVTIKDGHIHNNMPAFAPPIIYSIINLWDIQDGSKVTINDDSIILSDRQTLPFRRTDEHQGKEKYNVRRQLAYEIPKKGSTSYVEFQPSKSSDPIVVQFDRGHLAEARGTVIFNLNNLPNVRARSGNPISLKQKSQDNLIVTDVHTIIIHALDANSVKLKINNKILSKLSFHKDHDPKSNEIWISGPNIDVRGVPTTFNPRPFVIFQMGGKDYKIATKGDLDGMKKAEMPKNKGAWVNPKQQNLTLRIEKNPWTEVVRANNAGNRSIL